MTAFAIAAVGFSATNVTAQGKAGVWIIYTLFAAVGCIIAIPILLKYYKLRDKDVAHIIDCNNGLITREECEARIAKKG